MLNFERFNNILEQNGRQTDTLRYGENYIFHILYHRLSVKEINFNSFSLQDINNVIEEFGDYFEFIEDTEEYFINSKSPLYAMASTYNIISLLNSTPHLRFKRKHKFL